MDEHEALLEAARIVREGWSQGAFARDWEGHSVLIGSFRATNFCAVGAIRYVCGEAKHGLAVSAENRLWALLRKTWPNCTVPTWNDNVARTAKEVALKLEEAAA